MTLTIDDFRRLYNDVRPLEHLAGDRPIERYLADPAITPSPATLRTRQTMRMP